MPRVIPVPWPTANDLLQVVDITPVIPPDVESHVARTGKILFTEFSLTRIYGMLLDSTNLEPQVRNYYRSLIIQWLQPPTP